MISQPEQLHPGNRYLYRTKDEKGCDINQIVIFHRYRPHPGEVAVYQNGTVRIVSRRCLFDWNGANQEDKCPNQK